MDQIVNAIRDNLVSVIFSLILAVLTGMTTWSLAALLQLREDMIAVKTGLAAQSAFAVKEDMLTSELTALRLQQISTATNANAALINDINKRVAQCEARIRD